MSMMEKDPEGITNLIRLKERELHEIHDLRCTQLQKLIEERDLIILDSHKRFESLKEDFSYNLTLLEARDGEIKRLESQFDGLNASINELTEDKSSLLNRLEIMEKRDSEKTVKFDKEKTVSKRILAELKDAIESMKWASLEESKAKQREIDILREDNRLLTVSKEDSLEAQRRDLTKTFENLIAQREAGMTQKEREMGKNILLLDTKFERLSTDNSKLKSDLEESLRTVNKLENEAIGDKDKIRQLNYIIEDERLSKQQQQDVLERSLHQSQLELKTYTEKAEKSAFTLEVTISELTAQLKREKDFRELSDKALNEYRSNHQEVSQSTKMEISKMIEREDILVKENSQLKSEIEAAVLNTQALLHETELCKNNNHVLDSEILRLKKTIQESEIQCDNYKKMALDAESRVSTLQGNIDTQNEKEQVTTEENIRKETEYKNTIESLTTQLTEALQQVRTQVEGNMDAIQSNSDNVEDNKAKLQELEALLVQERRESAALRLRLQTSTAGNVGVPPTEEALQAKAAMSLSGGLHLGGPAGPQETSSPMFSEDFGPVSLPASPLATPNPSYGGGRLFRPGMTTASMESINEMRGVGEKDHNIEMLLEEKRVTIEENEKLKKVVHDMKAHIDLLNKGGGNAVGDNKIEFLEARLEKTTAEVVRLRAERKMLMDISNELRAALNKENTSNNAMGGQMIGQAKGPNYVFRSAQTGQAGYEQAVWNPPQPPQGNNQYMPPVLTNMPPLPPGGGPPIHLPDAISTINTFMGNLGETAIPNRSETVASLKLEGTAMNNTARGRGGGTSISSRVRGGRNIGNTGNAQSGPGGTAAGRGQPRRVMNYANKPKDDKA